MPRGERRARRAHRRAARVIGEQRVERACEIGRIPHLRARARRDRIGRRLREVEHVRPDQHRHADRARLDQVLAAERQQAAADERDVGGCIVRAQFAHRIAEQHRDVGRQRGGGRPACGGGRRVVRPFGAAHVAQPAPLDERRDFGEALRMTRHEDQQRARRLQRDECVEHERLFAVARARGHPHGPLADRRAPCAPARGELGRCRHVELQIAEHRDVARAERSQALRVGGALREHAREAAEHVARGGAEFRRAPERARRHPRVRQHERHVGAAAFVNERRPDLGLHHEPERRPPCAQEAPHGARQIVRQVAARHALAEDLLARRAAARRHVREQHVRVGARAQQRIDERLRGARLADRHRMHPHDRRRFVDVARERAPGPKPKRSPICSR